MKRCLAGLCLISVILATAQESTTPHSQKKIVNGITKKDLGIYKFFAWRYPITFECTVDGAIVKPGQSISIPAGKEKVTIGYSYEWYTPWGNKSGKKKTTFAIDNKTEQHTIGFKGWKTKQRLKLTDAKQLTPEKE